MTPRPAAHQVFLSFTISWSLLKLMAIEPMMPSNHLVLCCPLLLLPSVFPSIKVFSNESSLCIKWPKYSSFSLIISPSNEHSVLIPFRFDWFDLLEFQGTPKSLFQHHSSKTSILRFSAFFMVQLSHSYMTTGKTIALTIRTFVGKVIFLLFNTPSWFVNSFSSKEQASFNGLRLKLEPFPWLEKHFILAKGRLMCQARHLEWQVTHFVCVLRKMGFSGGSSGKESACNVGYLGLIPGLGRSPGEGNGYSLQYSGLERIP